jgi:isocitrate dehydrogenase (NAD+)
MHNVTLIKGDGIGPSIMDEAVKVIDASGVKIHWEEAYAGMTAFDKFGTPLPDETLASFDKTRLAFKGPLTTVVGTGFRSINVALRQKYELYANVRPAKSWPGIKTRYDDVDIVIVRENTEGLYAGLEHYLTPKKDIAESLAVVTRVASQRVIDYAFNYARANHRKKVTVCHKANILKYTQGLFLDVARETAALYPDIQFDEKIVDAACMHMVMNPQHFDVVVTTNMFGDILSDLTAGLVGGLGLIPGANIGDDAALFEAVHGSAPDITGKNLANPIAVIMAGGMMLNHLGESKAADRIKNAVEKVVNEGRYVTQDLNPQSNCGTVEMGNAIVNALR